ncbi:hypothetical protein Tco_1013685, partial [Tanacetum coccineum]
EFLVNVEPKKFKEAVQYPCWIDAMQEEIHEFKCLVVWELVPASSHSLVIVDVVFDGAFGGVRDEEVVVGEGVVVTSSSLDMLLNSCLGGIMAATRVSGELLNGELLNGELLNSELLNSELLNSELLNSELLNSELLNSELLNSELLNSELLNSELLNGELPNSVSTSSTDSQMHNNIMAAGSKDRPPMLGPGRYSQWRSRFLRRRSSCSSTTYISRNNIEHDSRE